MSLTKSAKTLAALALSICLACVALPAAPAHAATRVPAQVKSVKASSPAAGQLKVTWKTVSGAKGYKIRYGSKSSMKGAVTVTVKGANTKAKTLSGLKHGTRYYVQVRAYNAAKKLGKWSAVTSAVVAHKLVTHEAKDATCTEDGWNRYVSCTCGYSTFSKTNALGHTYAAATCSTPKTCTKCGATSGSPLAHTYKAATCSTPKTCTKCGATTGSPLAHTYKPATCTAPQTCYMCGETSGSPLGHRGGGTAVCTEAVKCTYCSTMYGPLGHTGGAATCTEAAKCERCRTAYGSPLGHSDFTGAICGRCGKPGREIPYTWAQLKTIAEEIAACTTESAALTKAQSYGLLGTDRLLTGDEVKTVTLTDNTKCTVQILGFNHDDAVNAEGKITGKAGITFAFKTLAAYHAMNPIKTNEGGWEASPMRQWLNSDFCTLLPSDLAPQIVPVAKKTNNKGKTTSSLDVTATTDTLWLPSFRECYGTGAGNADYENVFRDEGHQYKLYSDNEITAKTLIPSLLIKEQTNNDGLWWWLRSPNPSSGGTFFYVQYTGSWFVSDPCGGYGVAPSFCL